MQFYRLDVNFNAHKSYKKIKIRSPLIAALLGINKKEDRGLRHPEDERGHGTTAAGLRKEGDEYYVVNI